MTMFRYRGSAGHDFRIAANEVFRLYAAAEIQQVGIAVEVVKILQQGKIKGIFYVDVRLSLCEYRRKVHCKLFV